MKKFWKRYRNRCTQPVQATPAPAVETPVAESLAQEVNAETLVTMITEQMPESDVRTLIVDELTTMSDEGTDDAEALGNLFDTLLFDSGLDEQGKAEVKKAQAIFESIQ